jgi:hypothetical protein
MKGDLFRRYGGIREEVPDDVEIEGDGVVDLQAFGFLRGIRDRSVMLELRQKDGSIYAFSYAWLERAEFNPSDGIKLCFGGKAATIRGRNLNAEIRPGIRLFDALVRHRVPFIQESDGPTAMKAARDALVVDEISVK